MSINLPFGSAIHLSLQRFYRSIKENGKPEKLNVLQDIFQESLSSSLKRTPYPIIFKKDMLSKSAAIEMGHSLLQAFHESIDLTGYRVVDVELPLSATLYREETREQTDIKLVGIVDLLLMDEAGNLVAVDHKTASKPYAQETVDKDLQLTSYSYVLASNRFTFPTADIRCRIDVLRKLKKPRLDHIWTTRTAADRRRFAKLANAVLAGIDAQIYMPQPSWMCADCGLFRCL